MQSVIGRPVAVRLEPCETAWARVVDPGGKPVARPPGDLIVMMVVTPGPLSSPANDKAGVLPADEDNLTTVNPVNYPNELSPDAGGRITLPVLIPGATYRVLDDTAARPARRSARNSPSSRGRRSTWATSGSRSLRDEAGENLHGFGWSFLDALNSALRISRLPTSTFSVPSRVGQSTVLA